MASETVTFAENYDHKWSGRNAYTAYKAGWSGRVLAEVAEGARAKGALVESNAFPNTRDELEALAEAEGVDVSAIEGTGSRGYVTNDDVAAAIHAKRAEKPGQGEPGAVIGSGGPSGAEAPTE